MNAALFSGSRDGLIGADKAMSYRFVDKHKEGLVNYIDVQDAQGFAFRLLDLTKLLRRRQGRF